MSLVAVVLVIALLASSETVRRAIPSETIFMGGLVSVAVVFLFQSGRLG